MENKEKTSKGNDKARQEVTVNNHFSFSINFGDVLSLLTLIAGFFLIKNFFGQDKVEKKLKKNN
ncbi:hypothetical protein [Ureibacillus acetophenoni]|uniref:Uncharacterized protein n=1 Tax=Ureibacillus acetophenoni TaxID=614649 RepID=A0A285UIK7_9BACL|nr:hypothetical protein [Ureibacillus acetophenoni]SOC41527.1 hypothetical protein SAMN05877842_110138 [Ureibacillus acetophenoni]